MTTLIAGLATGLFAAFHFHRVAPFGLISNLAAMPIVSIVVMPMALVSVFAMPFGLEAFPLTVMGYGVEGVVWVAEHVAQLEPAGNTGKISLPALLLASAGLLLLCLLKTRLRLMGVPLFCLAFVIQTHSKVPDILILENGRQVALLHKGEPMVLLRPKAEKFSTKIWKRAFRPGELESASVSDKKVSKRDDKRKNSEALPSAFLCDENGCVANFKSMTIAVPKNRVALIDDCRLADIIVADFDLPDGCPGAYAKEGQIVIDRARLDRLGAHALTIVDEQSGQMKIDKALASNPRPWTRHRHSNGSGE